MSKPRDLLVLFRDEQMNPHSLEMQVTFFHELLYDVERSANVAAASEVIDMVLYRIVRKPVLVKRYMIKKAEAPFIFIFNRN